MAEKKVKKETTTHFNYNRLWKLLIDRGIKKQELQKKSDVTGIDYRINGGCNRLPGNTNISIKGAEGEMLLHRMDLKGICISTGSACDSVNTRVSHVIKAIHVPEEYAEGTIRVTFGAENTEEEAVTIAESLVGILKTM